VRSVYLHVHTHTHTHARTHTHTRTHKERERERDERVYARTCVRARRVYARTRVCVCACLVVRRVRMVCGASACSRSLPLMRGRAARVCAAPPWCERCVGMTIFTKEMKDRGMIPMCAGLRSRFPHDSARQELMMGDEEQSGEMEFDCCVGTSYQTDKMRKDAAAPVCTTGIHIARYRWANKEAAVVTHPDASDLDKGRTAAAAAGAAAAAPKTGPDPSRAFAKDSNARTSSSARAPSSPSSWTASFKTAWTQSQVIVEKTVVKATDPSYAAKLASSMGRAHTRLVQQAGAQVYLHHPPSTLHPFSKS